MSDQMMTPVLVLLDCTLKSATVRWIVCLEQTGVAPSSQYLLHGSVMNFTVSGCWLRLSAKIQRPKDVRVRGTYFTIKASKIMTSPFV